MKFTYLNMRRKARGGNAITASFFFNARGEYLERSVVGMYRALLLQLLEGYPDLQTVLDDPDLVSPNQEGCPSLNVLKNLFRSAVSALGQRSFTCFVDALDECDEQQVMDMVQYFEELAEPFIDHGLLLRICFSSRHYPYIVVQRGIRLTLEDQPGHAEDLKSYIANRLRVKHAAQLIEEILRKAGSVFLWVVLVVDILNKEYARGGLALRNRLKEIPSDLSELFRDILRRDKENMEDLLLCILWILYAKRPLQPKEFHHALWSGLSLKGLADSDIPDTTGPDADDSANRCVISSSKGLAEITKSKQPTVQFIHESVRDFLVKDKGLQELWPEFGFNSRSPSHERLKQCCDSYMNHTTVRASVDRSSFNGIPNEQAEILKQYPFLEYASQHVLYHSNAAADAIPQDKFLSDLSVSSWVSTNNLFEKFRVRKYTLDANLFYILAEKGFSELIRTRLKTDPNVHVYGERYRYPLFAALANGNNDAVAALLNSPSPICDGVDITEGLNTRKEFKNYQCQTPLFWAVQNGRQGIVKLLLQTDNSINEVEGVLQTLLSQASENGHEAVARLLIEKGADVNTCDSDGWKPINKALNSGHEAVASLLIENGADIDTCDKDGITPLLRASSIGNEAMVRFLLKNGANVNTCDRNGQTPLSQALPRGHEGVARLLIDKGADLNVGTSNSILWASLYGYAELAKRLIEKGENVNVCDVDKWSPLHHASANGHEAMVRVLIENGANVNACDNDKRTPLILASRVGNSYEVIASLLIEKGADVNACDKRGWTPLSRAISSGYGAMARLLVANGAVKESSN